MKINEETDYSIIIFHYKKEVLLLLVIEHVYGILCTTYPTKYLNNNSM